jgi:hypothetical protein
MTLEKWEIREHYKRPEIMETVLRVSSSGNFVRAGMKYTPNAYRDRETGEIKNSMDWYNLKPGNRKHKKKINISDKKDYINAVTECRSLYWTLNFFEKDIFDIDFREVEKTDSPMISRSYTSGYTFGIDIDHEHGKDIHDSNVKEAVEAMAQFFTNKLLEYCPNSVYVLFSGGGIYVMLHHNVFKEYFERFQKVDEWDMMLLTLLDSLDSFIQSARDDFFKLYPNYIGLVKPDALNGSQRVFKTIYSLHKDLDYACVPLDPLNIKIDFEKAKLPLNDSEIAKGKEWYIEYDNGKDFLNSLKPYLEKSYTHQKDKVSYRDGKDIAISLKPIEFEKWSPCMQNLYCLEECNEGQTRALAVFVSFLGQIGIPEDEAYIYFNDLADRWGARKSNIFESYFRSMNVPPCRKLNSDDNLGFPKGVSIRNLGVCVPDEKCANVPSPLYYTDGIANRNRLNENDDGYVSVINTRKNKR